MRACELKKKKRIKETKWSEKTVGVAEGSSWILFQIIQALKDYLLMFLTLSSLFYW